tara:strand:+ start:907 stop:1083 length:177 start_codon:yes stop_codon:yes gene_type:complete
MRKYWIYRGMKGLGFSKRVKDIILSTRQEAEDFCEEQDRLLPNAEHTVIEKHYGEEMD